jgi:hypothetical protein
MSAAGCVGEVIDEEGVDEEGNLGEAMQPVTYNGHDYLFVVTPRDWGAAKTTCELNGYKLVTINDASEESFLQYEESYRGGGQWWIGYHDQGIEGSWIWDDGTVINYSNWAPGEPNNDKNQDCAQDNYNGSGQWDDNYCTAGLKFICERTTIPDSNSGSFSYSASNTNSGTQNTTNISVPLWAGQTLTLGTCGVFGASYSGNTWLRLNNPSGGEVASFDNGCGGNGTNFSYIAPTTGTYIIRAGCSGSGSCNGTVAWTKN